MAALTNWISNNLLYSEVIAAGFVIAGAGIALKAGQAWGWLVLAGGVGLGFWALKLNGLV